MKIVIDIPESVIDRAKGKDGLKLCDIDIKFICNQLADGIVIPEGHGDLVDRDTIEVEEDVYFQNYIIHAPTVIPADKGE